MVAPTSPHGPSLEPDCERSSRRKARSPAIPKPADPAARKGVREKQEPEADDQRYGDDPIAGVEDEPVAYSREIDAARHEHAVWRHPESDVVRKDRLHDRNDDERGAD